MVRILKAPEIDEEILNKNAKIFLAGSIEMGKAVHWQKQVEDNLIGLDCTIYNPRRDDWDSSWVTSIDNDKFREQVEWELEYMDKADIIIVLFDPNTKSPITMMELGLQAKSGKLVVYCPDGFWKKGNVDIVCKKHSIYQVLSFAELINYVKYKINIINSSRTYTMYFDGTISGIDYK